MAYIDNSDTKREINDAIRGNAVSNIAPTQLANQVIPVIDVNPKHSRRCNILRRTIATNSTSATIYTTPADKDFYLTNASLAMIKDATATTTSVNIEVVVDGAGIQVLTIPSITLTAHTGEISQSFTTPIKVDRSSIIRVTSGTNVANVLAAGCIQGYTVEP